MVIVTYAIADEGKGEPMIAFREGKHLSKVTLVSLLDAVRLASTCGDPELAEIITRQIHLAEQETDRRRTQQV